MKAAYSKSQPAAPVRDFGTYEVIANAHTVAMQMKLIARMGWDEARGAFWIEYIGRTQ